MLTDKEATQFIEVIFDQPRDWVTKSEQEVFCGVESTRFSDDSGRWFIYKNPYQIGDRVPVHEEWRVYSADVFYDNGPYTIKIEYFTEDVKEYKIDTNPDEAKMLCNLKGWQPASTMPDWAVRTWRGVAKVETKQEWVNMPPPISRSRKQQWAWLITVEAADAKE